MDVDSATRQLHRIWDCGRAAGIEHAMFLNFGTLLGYVRDRALIPWDDDTDVGIRSDWITAEQESAFYEELCKANLFAYRRRHARRPDTHRALWWSLRSELRGTKNCVWFMFPWGNHLYHCKGKRWLKKLGQKGPVQKAIPNEILLEDCSTFAKGNSRECYDELIHVKFLDGRFRVPIGYGELLDQFYGDWAVPRQGGASAMHRLVLIQKWEDQRTWLVIQE